MPHETREADSDQVAAIHGRIRADFENGKISAPMAKALMAVARAGEHNSEHSESRVSNEVMPRRNHDRQS